MCAMQIMMQRFASQLVRVALNTYGRQIHSYTYGQLGFQLTRAVCVLDVGGIQRPDRKDVARAE